MMDVADVYAPELDLIEYDLTHPVQQLRYVRFAEYFLVFFGLTLPTSFAVQLFVAIRNYAPVPLFRFLVATILLADAVLMVASIIAYLGCNSLRSLNWRLYPFVFASAGLSAAFKGAALIVNLWHLAFPLSALIDGLVLAIALLGVMYSTAVAIMALRRLQSAVLPTTTSRIVDLMALSQSIRKKEAPATRRGRRVNRTLGIMFLAIGVIFVAVTGAGLLTFFGYFWLFKARQYLQVSADSLLAADRRQPILFLRSFADDPPKSIEISLSQITKTLDFSVETRLANYFMDFGPFIAIGAPAESVPVPGAARVQLSDDKWQQWVMTKMNESCMILMYAGVTHWVSWELSRVLEANLVDKLILLFPSPTGALKRSGFEEDMKNRLARVRATFEGTRWQSPLKNVTHPETIIAMCFDEAGSGTIFRSKRRNNDAYEIAVKIALLAKLSRLPAEA
jgi:hypothetical protein